MNSLSIILVSSGVVSETFFESCCEVLAILSLKDELGKAVSYFQPDIVVIDINTPFPGFFSAMKQLIEKYQVPVVVFTEDDNADFMQHAIMSGIASYLVGVPLQERMASILETARLRFRFYNSIKQELDDTRSELSERKEIEKAKGILMQQRQLSEAQAYQLLRQTAMNRNLRLIDLARSINSASKLLL